MGLGLVLAGVAAVGNLLGGRKRFKAQQRADADYQARLAAATGYDLVTLRQQAESSGFNPLTILQATGGQGYDYRGGVAGPGQAAQYAGYVGDAIATGADAFRQAMDFDRQMRVEEGRLDVDRAALAFDMGQRASVSPFGAASVKTTNSVLRGPVFGPFLPKDRVRVASMAGDVWLAKGAADRIGISWGQWLTAGDYTELLGELAGEFKSTSEIPLSNGPFIGAPKGGRTYFPPIKPPPGFTTPEWVAPIQ